MNKKEIIRVIVENLGGKENIINFSHCSTRLRFDLKTTRLVNCKAIEGL